MNVNWPRCLLWLIAGLVLAFLVLPLLVVIPISFSSASYLQFPPPGYSLRWYRSYFDDPQWIHATILSFEIALATAVAAVVLGGLAAIAMVRMAFPLKRTIQVILILPMIVPAIIISISIYSIYSRSHLVATIFGIIIAHTVLALPFAMTVLMSGLREMDRNLEDASYVMGASVWYTWWRVTFPILRPSIFSAAIFAFVISWDEIMIVLFIGGGEATTLPLKMFSYLRTEINPTISAVSTLLLAVVAIGFIGAEVVRFWISRPHRHT